MSKNKKKDNENLVLLHNDSDHSRVQDMSRRELLGQGLITGVGIGLAPSLMGIAQQAIAQDAASCAPQAGAGGGVPYVGVDLGGGAAITGGNVMVGGAGGQEDFLNPEAYKALGYLQGSHTDVDRSMGLVFHAQSAFLRGVKLHATAEALANTDGFVACSRSGNDTKNNPLNPGYLIGQLAGQGSVGTAMGSNDSTSGAKSQNPKASIIANLKPIKVSQSSDLKGFVPDVDPADQRLNTAQNQKLLSAINKLSEEQLKKMNNPANETKLLMDIVGCSYAEAQRIMANDPRDFDIMADQQLVGTRAYNQGNQTLAANQPIFDTSDVTFERKSRKVYNNRAATMAKGLLTGKFSVGNLEMGGYDYHNKSRKTGEERDWEAGRAVGAMIEKAHRLSKPIIIYMFSDGSVVANSGKADGSQDRVVNGIVIPGGNGRYVWQGDNSDRAGAIFLVYNPEGRAKLKTEGKRQLGAYIKTEGIIDRNASMVGNSAMNLAYAIAANYAALTGKMSQFMNLPGNPYNAGNIDGVIMFDQVLNKA